MERTANNFILPPLKVVDVDDRLGECLRRFLWQVVSDAALDQPVLILAGEFLRIRRGLRMGCAVRIAFEGDRGDSDDRKRGKPRFELVVFPLAVRQTKSPA